MNVTVSIVLGADEAAPTATPAEVLTALGGDPAKDTCNLSVSATSTPPAEPPVVLAGPKAE